MDSVILFEILEYLDDNNINKLFQIQPYQTNIQDIIDIIYNNKYITEAKEKQKWKNIYTFDILFSYDNIFSYIPNYVFSIYKFTNIEKYYKTIKNKKILNLQIIFLFNGQYSKILQSRLSLKDHIKYIHTSLMPGIIGLDFMIMRKYQNYKFIE
jgi:hypothetical protein